MGKGQKIWIWQKEIPSSEEDDWELKLDGIENAVIVGSPQATIATASVYCTDSEVARQLLDEHGGTIEESEVTDWVAENAVQEPPVLVRDAMVVTQEMDPEFLTKLTEQYPRRTILSVPAQMAFGTGQHETTSTCLRLLVDSARRWMPGWSMVDVGTGSGLLALGARVLGAGDGEVDAFDFDPKAVEISIENAQRNEISGIHFYEQDVLNWKPVRTYDVVAANLYSSLLEQAMPSLRAAAKPGATLILSGILRTQLDDVLAAARESGFEVEKTVARGKWVGVLGAAIAS